MSSDTRTIARPTIAAYNLTKQTGAQVPEPTNLAPAASQPALKAQAKNLLVVADVNAVPPSGVEGMELFMDGAPLPGCNALGVGPLAIGDIKYKTESGLFKRMIASSKPLHLDFRDAFQLARSLTT